MVILAIAIAAFLYLGFLAAGEELEEPFGEFPFSASAPVMDGTDALIKAMRRMTWTSTYSYAR